MFIRISSILISITLLLSCASQEAVNKEISKIKKGPSEKPYRTITNFSDGLRCMDNMMLEYGIRDISMLVEDLQDETTKVNAGTKDILITAISQMTRRSRAIKLIPYGNDSGNLLAFLANAGSKSIFNVVPQYDIRGSISQLDKNVAKKQSGGSLALDELSLGGSASTAGSILGIDLSVLTTSDLSVIPGVTSSNSVVLFKSGKGLDTDARIDKTGISFGFQVAKNDAIVQALRNLIELATIELIGRLTTIPYWDCLEIPQDSPEIQQEIADWFYAMRAHGELEAYIRGQMITRGFYPIGETSESYALRTAITSYQKSQNLPASGAMDFTLFNTLLGSKHINLEAKNITGSVNDPAKKAVQVKQTPTVPATTLQPIDLSLKSATNQLTFNQGDIVSLSLHSNQSAYAFCYLEDVNGSIQRFFPNRFESNNFIPAGSSIDLPGEMPFDIKAGQTGSLETINCYATRKNLFNKLPSQLQVGDFEPLSPNTLSSISAAYSTISGGDYAKAQFTIKSQ